MMSLALKQAKKMARRARTIREMQEAGAAAYVAGVPIEDCPLKPHQFGWREWHAGWRGADEEVSAASGRKDYF
jgi:hypothetical protein